MKRKEFDKHLRVECCKVGHFKYDINLKVARLKELISIDLRMSQTKEFSLPRIKSKSVCRETEGMPLTHR